MQEEVVVRDVPEGGRPALLLERVVLLHRLPARALAGARGELQERDEAGGGEAGGAAGGKGRFEGCFLIGCLILAEKI